MAERSARKCCFLEEEDVCFSKQVTVDACRRVGERPHLEAGAVEVAEAQDWTGSS